MSTFIGLLILDKNSSKILVYGFDFPSNLVRNSDHFIAKRNCFARKQFQFPPHIFECEAPNFEHNTQPDAFVMHRTTWTTVLQGLVLLFLLFSNIPRLSVCVWGPCIVYLFSIHVFFFLFFYLCNFLPPSYENVSVRFAESVCIYVRRCVSVRVWMYICFGAMNW